MTTQYANSFDHCKPFSDTNASTLLVASTALPYTVPGTANMIYRARISTGIGQNVWVKKNGTAVVPTSGVMTSTSNQEFVNSDLILYVSGGDTLSFISTGTPQIGISLLLVQQT
jgi:hypothetical protein